MNSAMLNQTSTYTEFAGLNALKAQARTDESAALKEVAKQFESMFVSMMMKSMRDANAPFEEGNFLKSNQSDFYRDMFDSQLSLSMTKGKGLGLAESLYRQLAQQAGLSQAPASINGSGKGIQEYARELPPQLQTMVNVVKEVDELVTQAETFAYPEKDSDDVITSLPLHEGEVDQASAKSELIRASVAESLPESFESPKEFVDYLYPVAKKVELDTGIDARFLLAQSALETGWGKHMIKEGNQAPSYNLFGIKADTRWQGEQVNITTTEYREGIALKERAAFRSYNNYEESLRDYVDFIKGNKRYSEAVKVIDDPEKFVEALHEAGYATDPNYSKKVQRIFNSDLLQSSLTSQQNRG